MVVILLLTVIILLLTRKLYYHNFELFLCLLLIVNYSFFHLLPPVNEYDVYWYVLLPILSFYLFEEIFVNRSKRFYLGAYGGWIISYFLLVLFGIFVAYFRGQGLGLGFKEAKYSILFLVYFLVFNKNTDPEKFTKYFIHLGCFLAVMITLQYLLYQRVHFFHIDYEKIEKLSDIDGLRFDESSSLVAVSTVLAFARYVRSNSRYYLLVSALLLLDFILVYKIRMFIAGLSLVAVVLFLCWKRRRFQSVFFLLMAVLLFGVLGSTFTERISQSQVYQKTVKNLNGEGGSVLARVNAYDYYIGRIKENPYTGYGIMNFNWEKNPDSRLQQQNIHSSDIGITHIVYESGLVGVAWLIGLTLTVFLRTRKVSCYQTEVYIFLAVIVSPTLDLFLRRDTLFLFSTFLGIAAVNECRSRLRPTPLAGPVSTGLDPQTAGPACTRA